MDFHKVSLPTYADSRKGVNNFIQEMEWAKLKFPVQATEDSIGYDFFAPFSFSLCPGESLIIPTGFKIKLDPMVGLFLFPRSGQGFNLFVRLANTVGLIDPGHYNNSENEGQIYVKLRNESTDKILIVEEGKGFCQGVLLQCLTTSKKAPSISRANLGGLGSTDSLGNQS